jgi:hypothetical protein
MALIYNEDGTCTIDMSATRRALVSLQRMQVGQHFIDHYRAGVAKRGVAAVAAQLKKQGVPLEIAQLIIHGRVTQ